MESHEPGRGNPLRLDPLFSYPLPVPEPPEYRDLGVGPDASPPEVASAKSAHVARLERERAELERSLEEVYRAVPGLREGYRRGSPTGEEAGPGEAAATAPPEDEAAAMRIDPDFASKRKRVEALEDAIRRINQQALENPENRSAFNRAHPPLGLLQLQECASDAFLRGANGLHMVRQDIAHHLAEREEAVFHPSDLTRDDFRSDFTPNPYLDGEDDGRAQA